VYQVKVVPSPAIPFAVKDVVASTHIGFRPAVMPERDGFALTVKVAF
jgi:hypothetical protein